jgi:hypothetical protein
MWPSEKLSGDIVAWSRMRSRYSLRTYGRFPPGALDGLPHAHRQKHERHPSETRRVRLTAVFLSINAAVLAMAMIVDVGVSDHLLLPEVPSRCLRG